MTLLPLPTLLPLSAIDAFALPRDRTTIDPQALTELQLSIATTGLRQPIEVWACPPPIPPSPMASSRACAA